MTTLARPKKVAICDTHSTYVAGCVECKERAAARGRARWRAQAYGTWQPSMVSAAEAHAHIRRLTDDYGMSLRQIAAAAGVGKTSVDRLVADSSGTANRRTVEAILAVGPAPTRGGRIISACGATRRVQALTAIGYDVTDLANRLGVGERWLRIYRRGGSDGISVRHHQRIAALFNTLSGTPGPSDAARALARSRNWAPPLMWDDDAHIDNPNRSVQWTADELSKRVVRRAIAGEVGAAGLNQAERRAAVAHLAGEGWSDRRIANHLNWPGASNEGRAAVRECRRRAGIPAGGRRVKTSTTAAEGRTSTPRRAA